MVTAHHSIPASDWTRVIDAALADWSRYLVGDATLKISAEFDPLTRYLASANSRAKSVGEENGVPVSISQAAATMQGGGDFGSDVYLTINPTWDWSFNGVGEPGKYDAQSVMTHELGHGLFALERTNGTSPFEMWRDANPGAIGPDGIHTTDTDSLMYKYGFKGQTHGVSDADAKMAGQSGIPTIFDDRVYLIDGAKVDGGTGNDTAIWLDSFDNYNADLTNFEQLELRGKDPLSAPQQDIYKLYQAGLNRAPDLAGFNYWENSNQDLMQMANGFLGAPEFAQSASIPGRGDYISALYNNVLGRDPEQAGLDYWTNRTDLDKGGLLANIALAPENEIDDVFFSL